MLKINLQGVRSAVKTAAAHGVNGTPVMTTQNATRGSASTNNSAIIEHIIHLVIG